MAGILDEVMDGIAAKEKQTQTTPPQTQTPATPPADGQTTPPAPEKKGIYDYSEDFMKLYGGKKKPA